LSSLRHPNSHDISSDFPSSEWYSQCIPGSGGAPSNTSPSNPPPTDSPAAPGELHDKFKAKGKLYFGTEIDHYHLNNNPLTTIAKNSFGQITAENSMKWDALEREFPCSPRRLGLN
jgi:endo-1,4-beta-xylanase